LYFQQYLRNKKFQLFLTAYIKCVYVILKRRGTRNTNIVFIFTWRMFPKGLSAGVYRALWGGRTFIRNVEINSLCSMAYNSSRPWLGLCETTKKLSAGVYRALWGGRTFFRNVAINSL
jgi:hypothetical protein